MDRLKRAFKRQSPVAEIVDDDTQTLAGREHRQETDAWEGYNTIQMQQPNGELITVRRKLEEWQCSEQPDIPVSTSDYLRPPSATGSFKTVLTHATDGKLVWVHRPIRNSAGPPIMSARSSQFDLAPRTMSGESFSVYSGGTERGFTASAMTILDVPSSAERQAQQQNRHSRRDGSAATASAASGNIQIGHVGEHHEDDEDDDYSSMYSASQYDENHERRLVGENGEDDHVRDRYTLPYDSGKFFESQDYTGYTRDFPASMSAAYFPLDYTESRADFEAKQRIHARDIYYAYRRPTSTRGTWARRLIRCCTWIVTACSILLPTAFLILAIVIIFSDGKSLSSGWSKMESIVDVSAAIWHVALAAVVAQGLKAWITLKAHSSQSRTSAREGNEKQPFSSYRLEVVCLLLVLAWCLSPVGSQALLHVYNLNNSVQTDQAEVWYIDRTGYNQVWSANSTNNMSASTRSELVQIIGEQYLGSLSPNSMELGSSGLADIGSHTQVTLASRSDASTTSVEDGGSDPLTLHFKSTVLSSDLDTTAGITTGNVTFSMTTSYLNLVCGNWQQETGGLENTTSPSQMFYSSSQTLGMNMTSGHDNATGAAAGTLSFVSLNRASTTNGTAPLLRRSTRATAAVASAKWQYSSIQCDYTQQFYDVPMTCGLSDGSGVVSCSQSGDAALIPSARGFSGTKLGDFVQDFMWTSNMPTASRAATATEKYIQTGGPADPASLLDSRLSSNASAPLNLSSTVTPEQFAERFGHLINTWVSLGYCPQCASGVLAGNSTVVPAGLQPYYRRAAATSTYPGDKTFAVNWAWLGVFLALAILLITAGAAAVSAESMAAGPGTARDKRGREDAFELQLPKTNSTVHGGQRSTQWAKGVMQEMDTAAWMNRS